MRPAALKRCAALAAFAAAFGLGIPAAASAHASLIAATPPWGAVLAKAPSELRLGFDETVVPRYARVSVFTGRGGNLAAAAQVAGTVVTVALRPGPVGSYTVRWRMVARNDGHATEGAYSFGVGVRPLPPAAVGSLGIPVAPQVLAWLQFLGVVLAGGMLTFRALVLAPAARGLGEDGGRESRVAMWTGAVGAAVALHAGVLAFLVGAYPIVGGGLSDFVNTEITPIRVGTHVGQAWMVSTFAWFAVLGLLVAAWVTPRRRERLLLVAGIVSLGIAFGISWASHPASRGTVGVLADWIHLVAAALWVGGVVAVAILALSTRPLSRAAFETLARTSILRFSKLVVPVVAIVGLAGGYLAWRELPSASAVLSTRYGLTLLVKTLAALTAVGLGAYHHRFAMRRLAAGAPLAVMRRTLALELGLLIAVLALAAALSQTAPPR